MQLDGDKLVYKFTAFTKIEIYLVSKNACLYVVWPSVYKFVVLWYVDTFLHTLAHASTARIQRETEMEHSAGQFTILAYDLLCLPSVRLRLYYRNSWGSIHNKPALSIALYHESRLHAIHNAYEAVHNLRDIHQGRRFRPAVYHSTFDSESNWVVLMHVMCVRCWSLVSQFNLLATEFYI